MDMDSVKVDSIMQGLRELRKYGFGLIQATSGYEQNIEEQKRRSRDLALVFLGPGKWDDETVSRLAFVIFDVSYWTIHSHQDEYPVKSYF